MSRGQCRCLIKKEQFGVIARTEWFSLDALELKLASDPRLVPPWSNYFLLVIVKNSPVPQPRATCRRGGQLAPGVNSVLQSHGSGVNGACGRPSCLRISTASSAISHPLPPECVPGNARAEHLPDSPGSASWASYRRLVELVVAVEVWVEQRAQKSGRDDGHAGPAEAVRLRLCVNSTSSLLPKSLRASAPSWMRNSAPVAA